MNTIKILKSSNAVIVVLVLALLAQMPHAQYVFYARSREQDLFGLLVTSVGAVALEIAVLVFAVRGNVRVSWGFAVFSTCINLVYYYDTLSSLWTPANWLLSIGLPVAIALYSHEVIEQQPDEATLQSEPKQPSKRVTRTVSVARTETQSEQYTLQPEPECATIVVDQPAAPLQLADTVDSDTAIELDIATMSTEQKKQHFATVLRAGGKVNKSAFASQYGVARTTIIRWMAELQPA